MSVIEDFIVASNEATTLDVLFAHLRKAMGSLGYDSIVYNLINDHPSLNLKAQHSVVSSYPNDLMMYLAGEGLLEADPIFPYCFMKSHSFSWDDVLSRPHVTKLGHRLADELRAGGLVDGVGIPIHGPNSEVACLALAAPSRVEPDRNILSSLQALGTQFHVAHCHMAQQSPIRPFVELTAREREILMWSAEGKSVYAIGQILSVSENTIKFHLKKIYRKLAVTDRMQAVIMAMFLGLINPPNVRNIQQSYPVG